MENGSKDGIYEFDRFRLDAEKLMLYRDESEVTMPPKMVKTLAVLVESRGTILSKDELIDRVWTDTIVDESNLSQHLYHLRKILGTRPGGRPYIETLRRRGYRFNGEVSCRSSSVGNRTPSRSAPDMANQPVIERRGNVLRLVDWETPTERQLLSPAIGLDKIEKAPNRAMMPAIVAAIIIGVVLASLGGFSLYRRAAETRSSAPPELTMQRLTNGIKPVSATISPNGDYFVYDELAEDGQRLWLQQVGQSSRVEIVPPFGKYLSEKTFTPDGSFVYFSASNETGETSLYRVATFGGPRSVILSDINGAVSFSPDGRELVFVRSDRRTGSSALVIANSDGGDQRILFQKEGPSQLVGSPSWSPDGSTIAFAVRSVEPGVYGVFSVDVSSGSVKSVTDERWDNIYRIVWTHEGSGLVMIATRLNEAYSTKRNQVYYLSYPNGASHRLTTDGSWHQEWSLGVTKDDAIIAVPFNRSAQIWSMDAGGDAATAVQISHGLRDGPAGIAPIADGRVGFISRSGDELTVWVMNADGTNLKQLNSGLSAVEELRADAQGRFFVFAGSKERQMHLFRLDLDSQSLTQMTFGDSRDVDSTVSPDSKWVVYASTMPNGEVALFKIPSDGGEPVRVSDGVCRSPNYSPSGDRLSCMRGSEVVILSAADGSEIASVQTLPYATTNFGARWTPDGNGLVYIRSEKGFSNLWVQPLNGKPPHPLTNFTAGEIANFAFSIDGTRLFVARGSQIQDAILIRNYR